jgi:hypothetical protein
MSIQHVNIPNAQLHESKGVSTAAANSVYIANGTGSGVWRKPTDLDTDYSDKTKNKFGWNDVADSLYTLAGPRTILSGVRTQLTNNGVSAQSDTSRLGSLWDPVLNQFLINDLNGFYIVRTSFKIKASATAGTPYIATLEYQSSNGPTVISGDSRLIKGGSAVNQISMTQGFYNGSFINNQALKLYLTADTDITLYDIGFIVERTYVEV